MHQKGGSVMVAHNKNVVQIRHPMTGLYVRINRVKGKITGHKRTSGPYKGIPIARKRRVRSAPAAPTTTTKRTIKKAVYSGTRTRTRAHAREAANVGSLVMGVT